MQTGRRGFAVSHLWINSYTKRVLFYVTALVSVAVIFGAVSSYLVMRNQISNMAAERTLQELRRTGASFSTMFASSIIPAAEQVFETSEVNNLIYGSTFSVQQLLTATQFLDRFQLANPLIDSIAVYNSQQSMIYSTRYGLVSATDSRNTVLMRIFRQIADFRLYRFIPRRDGGKNLLTVILGSRPYKGNRLLGALVVNVDEAAVRSQLLGRVQEDGTRMTILDSAGMLLSDDNPAAFGTDAESDPLLKRVVRSDGESGSFTVVNGQSTSLVSFYREPLAGWTFVSATPSHLLFAGIARWRNEIIIIFSILLALSVALALTASRRVSRPFERLRIQARELQAGLSELRPSEVHRDDIALISETMELLHQRLDNLSRVRASAELALARVFGRVLLDQAVSDDERARLRRTLFDSASGEVWILVFVVDRMEFFRHDDRRARLLELCRDLSRRLAELPEVLCTVEIEKGTIAAALPASGGDRFVLPGQLHEVIDAVSARPDVAFTVGVSDPVSDLDELPGAYDGATEAVHYRFREGRGRVITQARKSTEESSYSLPEEELRRLAEQARLLNETAVDATIRSLLDGVRSRRYEDFVFLSQYVLHVLDRVFVETGTMDGRGLAEFRALVLNVKWIETGDDVQELAMLWYRRFVETAADGSGQRLSTFVADVKKVIEQTLFDPDLSTKSIAATLKLSVNYVRATFRSATGESISSYITRLRIERCKELLKDSSLPIKEIAFSVGFRNYNYFFTLFKKQTGRTPQEYQRRIIMM